MSLFDNRPITIDEIRQRLALTDGATIRKYSGGIKPVLRTLRHKPWWMLLGKGPDETTCGDCQFLKKRGGKYFKCGRQAMTSGPGTDIRKGDAACRLFEAGLREIGHELSK